jgi:hypothetical protein
MSRLCNKLYDEPTTPGALVLRSCSGKGLARAHPNGSESQSPRFGSYISSSVRSITPLPSSCTARDAGSTVSRGPAQVSAAISCEE